MPRSSIEDGDAHPARLKPLPSWSRARYSDSADLAGLVREMSGSGQTLPNEAIDIESALTSTPDVSLHRTKRREGPIVLQKSLKPER
jgi:hypothetical protein